MGSPRSLVPWVLFAALLWGCDSPRRVTAGPRGATRVVDSGGGQGGDPDANLDDAGRPNVHDAGFDDAGRPIAYDAGAGSSATNFAAYCMELLQIECEANARCCMSSRGLYPSIGACTAELSQRWCLTGVAFDDGRVRFDAAAARRILDARRSAAASCQYSIEVLEFPTLGTVRVGGECTSSVDPSANFSCVPGAYCRGSEASDAYCEAYAASGGSCASASCPPPESCDARTQRCTPGLALGQGCGEDNGQCARSLCQDGRCVARVPYDFCRGE